MDFTTDKLRSLVRKWQTLIEAHVDVKTTDGYTLRVFCISFTKKRQGQIKRTCYAQSAQVRTARNAGRGWSWDGAWRRDGMGQGSKTGWSVACKRAGRNLRGVKVLEAMACANGV